MVFLRETYGFLELSWTGPFGTNEPFYIMKNKIYRKYYFQKATKYHRKNV
jgi:hypothetical protein